MILCPRGCSRPFVDELELYRHLRDSHRIPDYEARRLAGTGTDGTGIRPGWYEGQTETPTGMKAKEHQIAAAKALAASRNTLSVPFIPIPIKPTVSIQENWKKTQTGYTYLRVVREEHTAENVLKRIIRGEIYGDHGSLTLWTYDKDTSELSGMQDKARILEARLVGYVPSDPEFVVVVNELHDLKYQIQKQIKEIVPEKYHELILEDHYQGNDVLGENNYEKWVEGFMKACNDTTESTINEVSKSDPIILK